MLVSPGQLDACLFWLNLPPEPLSRGCRVENIQTSHFPKKNGKSETFLRNYLLRGERLAGVQGKTNRRGACLRVVVLEIQSTERYGKGRAES